MGVPTPTVGSRHAAAEAFAPARPAVLSVATEVPSARVTTAELAERLGVSEDWIVSRTGIRSRHVAGLSEGESVKFADDVGGSADREIKSAGNAEPAVRYPVFQRVTWPKHHVGVSIGLSHEILGK